MTMTAEQITDRIRELTAHLNANIQRAVDMGLRVEFSTIEQQEMQHQWPVPFVQVAVTQRVR